MTIGRCSITEDPDAGSLRQRGDVVSFSSVINASSVDEMKARVQQLRGLMDNDDETVFPFTWSEDSSFDGFYTDFQVEVADYATMLTNGACPFSLTMRRVGGFTAPQFECIATTVVATNAHGLPTSTPAGIVALPYTNLQEASIPTSFAGGSSNSFLIGTTRTTADGLVRYCAPTDQTPFRYMWATSPAYYYEGSARFEQSFGGTYYEMNGQQVRPVSSAWRISNGLMRVTISGTTISVAHYDGSTWDTAKLWTIGGVTPTAPLLASVTSARVIRNTPEEVIVRVVPKMEATASSTVVDISLRRGCRWAAFSLTSNYTTDWYINTSPNEAGTALTGGFRATATDAAGNRYVVGGLAAQTNTLANGRLKLTTAAQTFNFVIGSEVGADGSGQTVLNQYAQTVIENHRVVVR